MIQKQSNVRLNLSIAQPVRDRLEAVRIQTEATSLTVVIRQSLAVYEHLIKAQKDGARIIIRRPNGEETEVLLVP